MAITNLAGQKMEFCEGFICKCAKAGETFQRFIYLYFAQGQVCDLCQNRTILQCTLAV